MEAKKNPEKDIHQHSGMFFLIGLGISISVIICAFEWTTVKTIVTREPAQDNPLETFMKDPVAIVDEPPVPTPVQLTKKQPLTPEVIEAAIVTQNENLPDLQPEFYPEVSPVGNPDIEVIPEKVDDVVVFAEQQPQPEGGIEAMYKFLASQMKYPRRAIRDEIKGKVFVQFIVNRDGIPGDLQVIQGISQECDAEAKRVIGLTRWQPGKQRGKAVRVRMVLPVYFVLQ